MATIIGKETKQAILNMISGHMEQWAREINEAFGDSGEISMSFSVKVQRTVEGKNDIEVGINFVKERCKDSVKTMVDEDQVLMFKLATPGNHEGQTPDPRFRYPVGDEG